MCISNLSGISTLQVPFLNLSRHYIASCIHLTRYPSYPRETTMGPKNMMLKPYL